MSEFNNIKLNNFKYLEQTTSTSDVILDMAKQGACEYTCVLAEKQTKGRGRLEKVWKTYENKSLAFSFLVYDFVETMPLVLVCSLHKILTKRYNADVKVKWPNDIYINNKKLSGLLVESFPVNNKRAYVVGLGLNVFKSENEEILPMVGFLENYTDLKINRAILFEEIFNQIKEDFITLKKEGFENFCKYFTDNCLYLGDEIEVNCPNGIQKGTMLGINDQGYLILKQKKVILNISAGQIVQKK